MAHADLSILPVDHPGAHDLEYRARRNTIAEAAAHFRIHPAVIPEIEYTDVEHKTWQRAVANLKPLHQQYAHKDYLTARERLSISSERIPQLRELNQELRIKHNFGLEPIEGLVDSRSFLSRLADGVMLCTQYIRHHSRPDYTPEPDIIHEVIGHVATFTDPDIVRFSKHIGQLVKKADDQELIALERLYWFTLEFGLIQEGADTKIFGAGLLSSSGEMPHALSNKVTRRPFSIEEVTKTPFDFSTMQPMLFVIPSFHHLRELTEKAFPLH